MLCFNRCIARRFLVFFSFSFSVSAAPLSQPQRRLPRLAASMPSFVPAPGTNDAVNVVIPQPDGKVIVAGRFTQANNVGRNRIARFNLTARSIPPSILARARMGKLMPPFFNPTDALLWRAVSPFQRVTHNGVCRLNANGSVDPDFGLGTGINNSAALALAFQSDGRIIVGGQFSQIDLTRVSISPGSIRTAVST